MVMDPEVQRHAETWHGFFRFIQYGAGAVIVILILMALFLL
jgi:hypothetical protein